MEIDMFLQLSTDLIFLQLNMKRSQECSHLVDITDITELMKIEQARHPVAVAMANYFCGHWEVAIHELEHFYRNSLDYHRIRTALAFSYVRKSEHSKAHKILKGLWIDQKHASETATVEMVNIQRLLAACANKLGQPKHEVEELFENAIRILQESKVDSNELRQISCHLNMEYGIFLTDIGGKQAKALQLLNDALNSLVLKDATSYKCKSLYVLSEFPKYGPSKKLDFIGNSTRELAHCVFSIGKLLRNTDEMLADMYYKKAHQLGMQFVMTGGIDSYTRVIILTDLCKALENEAYLKGALQILQHLNEKERRDQLETELILSVVECLGHKREDALSEYQIELEHELNSLISQSQMPDCDDESETTLSLLISKRTEAWYTTAINALKKLPKDMTSKEREMLESFRNTSQKHKICSSAMEKHFKAYEKELRAECETKIAGMFQA